MDEWSRGRFYVFRSDTFGNAGQPIYPGNGTPKLATTSFQLVRMTSRGVAHRRRRCSATGMTCTLTYWLSGSNVRMYWPKSRIWPNLTQTARGNRSISSLLSFVCKQTDDKELKLLLVDCLTSQKHVTLFQGQICVDERTCCYTGIDVADQTAGKPVPVLTM